MTNKSTQQLSKILLFLITTAFLIINNCFRDADRDNPLDPKSDLYNAQGSINGNVTSYYPPHVGIEDVELKLIPCYQGAVTDKAGYYQIDRIPGGRYLLIASKPGYAPDSTALTVTNGHQTAHNFKLDALPVLSRPNVISSHISRWFPRPYDLFYIKFQVEVTDPDGANDISSVTIGSEELELEDTLRFSAETGFYQTMIDASTIDENNTGALIGRPVMFSAEDKVGHKSASQPVRLLQIIHETPEAISPAGLQSVNSTPQLTWKALNPVFLFSYLVEINRTDVPVLTQVWSQENIAATDTTITVSDSLETGRYYWTVSIVDEFGNFSRSKEAPFQIR